jgi:NLR family CARD domain-containing protein 3
VPSRFGFNLRIDRYNWITDRAAHAIYEVTISCPTIVNLNLGHCALTHEGLSLLLEAVTSSPTLLFYNARKIFPQEKVPVAIATGQRHAVLLKHARVKLAENVKRVYGNDMSYDKFMADDKRWLVNDETDVRKIASVYR